ncbi:Methyltransferase-like protein 16 [Oopsacas minuta]|uniref:Methyltransferase-like protein 16 n=1 Tax=Oopsacas minuta TaxID=111878 RepID=A0AAV7JW05_9METZ|nr:Methyltransferase-like protein 16 [Oopsacas minuta]
MYILYLAPEDRTSHRPSNNTSRQECMLEECVTEGGELKFVKKIIEESLLLRNRVTWFSSMLGKKCHVAILLKVLEAEKVPKITQTEFIQGKTRRWAIAWSFDLHFKSWVPLITPSVQKPLFIQLYKEEGATMKIDKVLMDVFESLQLEIEVYEGSKYICIAYRNTWANQRRKKRIKKMRESLSMEEDNQVVGCKRKYSDSEDMIEDKAVKLESEYLCLIEFLVEIKEGSEIEKGEFKKGLTEDGIYLRLEALETSNKEILHQIAQYIQNNLI